MKILGSGVTLIYRYRLISSSPVPFYFIFTGTTIYSPVPFYFIFTGTTIYSPVQFYFIFTGTTYLFTGTVLFYLHRYHFLYSPVLFFIHRYLNFHSSGPGRILFTGPELIIGSILFTGPAFSGSGLTGYAGPNGVLHPGSDSVSVLLVPFIN